MINYIIIHYIIHIYIYNRFNKCVDNNMNINAYTFLRASQICAHDRQDNIYTINIKYV